jgi:hypothetical protein
MNYFIWAGAGVIAICILMLSIQESRITNFKAQIEILQNEITQRDAFVLELQKESKQSAQKAETAYKAAMDQVKKSQKQAIKIIQAPVPKNCTDAIKWAAKQRSLLV